MRSPRVRGGCDVNRETLVTRGLRPPGHNMTVWCVMCSVQILWILWTRAQSQTRVQDSSRRWLRLRPSHIGGYKASRWAGPRSETGERGRPGQWVPGPRHSVNTRPGPGAVRHYHYHHDVMITVTQWPVISDKNRNIQDVQLTDGQLFKVESVTQIMWAIIN